MSRGGYFIAFEGIDCCGKQTQLERVSAWLEAKGYLVWTGAEPNDVASPMGMRIRKILQGNLPVPPPLDLQRMFVIDRAQDVCCFIQPALERGWIVLMERFALSTVAYGMLTGKPADAFVQLHHDILGPLMRWPDLTILLDIPSEVALERHRARGGSNELCERAAVLEKVRVNYAQAANHSHVGNVEVVDGAQSPDAVFVDIQEIIEPRLPQLI